MNTEIKKLSGRIEALKEASMLDAKERADACLHQAKVVLNDIDGRLIRLEKLFENVEPIK